MMSKYFDSHDKGLVKKLYGLTDSEVFDAEKLFIRSSFSVCGAAKVIKDRRAKGR